MHFSRKCERSPSSNSAQLPSLPDYDEINYYSNYRHNTIIFPLPSTVAAYLSERGNNPTPYLPRRPTQSQRYQARACNLDPLTQISQGQQPLTQGSCPHLIAAAWNATTRPLHPYRPTSDKTLFSGQVSYIAPTHVYMYI